MSVSLLTIDQATSILIERIRSSSRILRGAGVPDQGAFYIRWDDIEADIDRLEDALHEQAAPQPDDELSPATRAAIDARVEAIARGEL